MPRKKIDKTKTTLPLTLQVADEQEQKAKNLEAQGQGYTDKQAYQDALEKTLVIFHGIADTLNTEQIKKMTPAQKISALKDLNQIFTSARIRAPRSSVFVNFNIDKASAADIEKKMQEYSDEQEGEA